MENYKRYSNIALIFSVLFCLLVATTAVAESENFLSVSEASSTDANVFHYVESNSASPSPTKKKPKKKQSNGKKVSFENYEENYQKACNYYENQMFISAARIFEELYPLSLGTPRADTILYLFADCYYMNRDYEMAAFHFKEYANKYTSNPRAEEAYYKAIKALSNTSPEYSLDQTETYYVIEEIEVFTRQYPQSKYMEECNALLDQMRDKLAKKSYEILKLYYNTENYKSAQIMARNFFKEHSSSQYLDDAYAILVKNNYEYAHKSVDSKKIERFTACVDAYQSMKIYCPGSDLLEEAEKLAVDAQNKIDKKEFKKSKKKDKKHED